MSARGELIRSTIQVTGIVQGVGFRPFVYGLALESGLSGSVCNNTRGVAIDVEGNSSQIESFIRNLIDNAPPIAMIDGVTRDDQPGSRTLQGFRIVGSQTVGERSITISPDVGTCSDCISEMLDPSNRRYLCPFINCTNCGPRFTIVEGSPYDRSRTTMGAFSMCSACRDEYQDPQNRRFHAEPTCCPSCGPRMELRASASDQSVFGDAAIDRARELLQAGKILAVKGIGGFHLVCDATNERTVAELRRRKKRDEKPFALMAGSLNMIERYCSVSESERLLLESASRPIVLLERRDDGGTNIAETIAPRMRSLGFMLPYSPLHHLLLDGSAAPLVMTSGNESEAPITFADEDAKHVLDPLSDYFLTHNRRINVRTDDSVARCHKGDVMMLRRSRGYSPMPIRTAFRSPKAILACGAELKNTFCLAEDDRAYVSHHIGDLENLETYVSYVDAIKHYCSIFDIEPEVIAHDLHPEYLSTKFALDGDIEPRVGVQHHHAHIASCLADNGYEGEAVGVALDGLGFGNDGTLWGGEFLIADLLDAERVAHLEPVPMPGGSKAIRQPWRMALAYLDHAYDDATDVPRIDLLDRLDERDRRTVASMIRSGLNSPLTSSMGRLFDAVAALCGLRDEVTFEGQAAIAVEQAADRSIRSAYHFDWSDTGTIKTASVIRQVVDDVSNGCPAAEVAAKFQNGVIDLIVGVVSEIAGQRGLRHVALSGGVFQNMALLTGVCERLSRSDLIVLRHRKVPTNDGGISLGQAAVASARLAAGRI